MSYLRIKDVGGSPRRMKDGTPYIRAKRGSATGGSRNSGKTETRFIVLVARAGAKLEKASRAKTRTVKR